MATPDYKFRAFEEESATLSAIDHILIVIDENRAASVMIAVGVFLVMSFFFGYGAGGVVDRLVGLIV